MKDYSEKEIRETLGKEMQVSETVNQRLEEVYGQIRSGEVTMKKRKKSWYRGAGTAAAVLAAGVFCVSNPALAAKIPFLGNIFAEVEQDASYPGDYNGIGTVLVTETENGKETADTAGESEPAVSGEAGTESEGIVDEMAERKVESGKYSKTSDGLTVSLSEVYCNEAALYLTMELTSEEPFEDCMTDMNGTPLLAAEGRLQFAFNQETFPFLVYLDGHFADENTFLALYRFDLKEVLTDRSEYLEAAEAAGEELTEEDYEKLVKEVELPEEFELHLSIGRMVGERAEVPTIYEVAGIPQPTEEELLAMSEEEWRTYQDELTELVPDYFDFPSPYENFWYDGPFDFDLQIQVDHERTKTCPVDDGERKEHYVESVTVTPFEMVINEIGTDAKASEDLVLYVLDADGKHISTGLSGGREDTLSVADHDISRIDIYYLPWENWEQDIKGTWFDTHTEKDGKTLKELCDEYSVYHQAVDIQ